MHISLRPETNIKLLVVWGIVALGVALVTAPASWLFLGVGIVLGSSAGIIQLRSLRESLASLLAAQTAMDIRRILNASRAGRLYLYVFWGGMAALFVLAFYLLQGRALIGLLAGYSAFAFMRELLTLRGAYELQKFSRKP